MLRISISNMINDIINQTKENIKIYDIDNINKVFTNNDFIVSMSKKMKDDCLVIKDFLFSNVYNHKKLYTKRQNVEEVLIKLFKYFKQFYTNKILIQGADSPSLNNSDWEGIALEEPYIDNPLESK